MSNVKSDAMITRLEKEVEERNAFIEGVVAGAQDADRDLTPTENELLTEARKRIEACEAQLETLSETRHAAVRSRKRIDEVDRELLKLRGQVDLESTVEYRSAGAWMLDSYRAAMGDREAVDRLEVFNRVAAHQKTSDNPGTVPDPVIGSVINYIDAARPIVSFTGPRDMPSALWHRPKVTQHTQVGVQGSAGAASDEKSELDSRKMTISRINAAAVTYGGYVNVSRQNLDFGAGTLDLIINDLAAQYAIETEAAAAAALATTLTSAVEYDPSDADSVAAAIWSAVASAYAATKGQGRLVLAVATDVLGTFGPLFAPVNPQNAQSAGFTAGMFGQGQMGTISGVPVVMSSGLSAGEAFLYSTAAFEVYEQRVGALQVVEPSVLGVQVAYAGYFTPLVIEDDAIVPLTVEGSS